MALIVCQASRGTPTGWTRACRTHPMLGNLCRDVNSFLGHTLSFHSGTSGVHSLRREERARSTGGGARGLPQDGIVNQG